MQHARARPTRPPRTPSASPRRCASAPSSPRRRARTSPTPTGTATGHRHRHGRPAPATATAHGADRPHGHRHAPPRAGSGLPGAFVKSTTDADPERRRRPRPPTDGHRHRHGATRRADGRQRPRLGHRRPRQGLPGARLLRARRRSTRSSTTRTKPLVTCSDDGADEVHPRPGRGRRRPDQGRRRPATDRCRTASRPTPSRSSSTFNGQRHQGLRRRSPSGWSTCPTPRNQFAIMLDSQVIVGARLRRRRSSTARPASPATFTIDSARDLANQLKFGALPLSFTLQTRDQISPTLGSEQLRWA